MCPGLAQTFSRAIGQYFVGVHVVRRAGAGLIHVHHELIAELPGEDSSAAATIASPTARSRRPSARLASAAAFLISTVAHDQIGVRAQPADGEVLHGARGLDAVVRASRNGVLAERIALGTGVHGGFTAIL
jgi:hypothetical protein